MLGNFDLKDGISILEKLVSMFVLHFGRIVGNNLLSEDGFR